MLSVSNRSTDTQQRLDFNLAFINTHFLSRFPINNPAVRRLIW